MKSRTSLLIFFFSFALLGFAGVLSAQGIPQPSSSTLSTEEDPLVIAVMPFTNLSGQKEYDWLSVGIGEVMSTKLGGLSCFRLVERIKLAEALKKVALEQTGPIDESAAPRVGQMTGAEGVLAGSFQISGQKIRIDARLLDVRTGRVDMATGAVDELDRIFELQERVSASLLAAMKLPLTDEEKNLLVSQPTTSMEAFKLYSQATDAYTLQGMALDDEQRIALLNQSTQLDPNFAMAYGYLGDIFAYRRLNYPLAVIYYTRVIRLQPHNPAPRIWLTRIYQREGNAAAAQREESRLEEMRRGALAKSPHLPFDRSRIIAQKKRDLKSPGQQVIEEMRRTHPYLHGFPIDRPQSVQAPVRTYSSDPSPQPAESPRVSSPDGRNHLPPPQYNQGGPVQAQPNTQSPQPGQRQAPKGAGKRGAQGGKR